MQNRPGSGRFCTKSGNSGQRSGPIRYRAEVLAVGLTGGIGAGKSTVSSLLALRGAVVVDADGVYAGMTGPGGAAIEPLRARFGDSVIRPDGSLDRPALAAIVFNDPAARLDLNQITHPLIGAGIAERMAAEAETDHIVILDVPLLLDSKRLRPDLAGVIVVDAPIEVAVRRLVELRQMSEDDARARIAAQVSREERLARADFVIDNRGSIAELEDETERAWEWIQSLC